MKYIKILIVNALLGCSPLLYSADIKIEILADQNPLGSFATMIITSDNAAITAQIILPESNAPEYMIRLPNRARATSENPELSIQYAKTLDPLLNTNVLETITEFFNTYNSVEKIKQAVEELNNKAHLKMEEEEEEENCALRKKTAYQKLPFKDKFEQAWDIVEKELNAAREFHSNKNR